MSEAVPLFSKLDPEVEGRRALARVYGLLLKLADEFEEDTDALEPSNDEDKVAEPTFVQLELLESNIPS
jgi:hypothetical protein